MDDPALHAQRIASASCVAEAKDGILDAVMRELAPFLTHVSPNPDTATGAATGTTPHHAGA